MSSAGAYAAMLLLLLLLAVLLLLLQQQEQLALLLLLLHLLLLLPLAAPRGSDISLRPSSDLAPACRWTGVIEVGQRRRHRRLQAAAAAFSYIPDFTTSTPSYFSIFLPFLLQFYCKDFYTYRILQLCKKIFFFHFFPFWKWLAFFQFIVMFPFFYFEVFGKEIGKPSDFLWKRILKK